MEEEEIKTDIHCGTFTYNPKPKSKIMIGKDQGFTIYTEQKFNKLQKKMWKFLLGISIEDMKE